MVKLSYKYKRNWNGSLDSKYILIPTNCRVVECVKLKNVILPIIISTILASCSTPFGHIGKCPDAEISWADVLKINDIKYEHRSDLVDEENNLVIEKGNK